MKILTHSSQTITLGVTLVSITPPGSTIYFCIVYGIDALLRCQDGGEKDGSCSSSMRRQKGNPANVRTNKRVDKGHIHLLHYCINMNQHKIKLSLCMQIVPTITKKSNSNTFVRSTLLNKPWYEVYIMRSSHSGQLSTNWINQSYKHQQFTKFTIRVQNWKKRHIYRPIMFWLGLDRWIETYNVLNIFTFYRFKAGHIHIIVGINARRPRKHALFS